MLRDSRRLDAPELDAFHTQVDVRTPSLRVGIYHGRNVASDYALVQLASPFLHHLRRPELTILLDGYGRFEERGRRGRLEPGVVALSDQGRHGTEAFGGTVCRSLVLDWDPAVVGAPIQGAFRLEAIRPVELRRLDEASRRLAGRDPAEAMSTIVGLLRSWGLPLEPLDPRAIASAPEDSQDAQAGAAFSEQLSKLEQHPAIQDLVARLGTNERQVNRRLQRMARRYALPWAHWRGALRHARLVQAVRLLAAPGATTELVSRLTGFRSPTALCHAFAKGGLPSPGVVARAARRDVLESWTAFVPTAGHPADAA